MRALAILISAAVFSAAAAAQTYPARPVRMIVRSRPAVRWTRWRARSARSSASLGAARPGRQQAGRRGNIAADAVSKAPADGYTLLITTQGFAISPGLYKKLPFDARAGLRAGHPADLLVSRARVQPQLPSQSIRELVALARSGPNAINYGSTGTGAPPHLLGELLKSTSGIDMLHVPYKATRRSRRRCSRAKCKSRSCRSRACCRTSGRAACARSA